MNTEKFFNNGDSYDELFDNFLGYFTKTNVNSFTTIQGTSTSKGMIYLYNVFYPKIESLEVDGGFKLTKTYDLTQA